MSNILQSFDHEKHHIANAFSSAWPAYNAPYLQDLPILLPDGSTHHANCARTRCALALPDGTNSIECDSCTHYKGFSSSLPGNLEALLKNLADAMPHHIDGPVHKSHWTMLHTLQRPFSRPFHETRRQLQRVGHCTALWTKLTGHRLRDSARRTFSYSRRKIVVTYEEEVTEGTERQRRRDKEREEEREVKDLTDDVVISQPYAIAHGGFSDIHRGVLSGAAMAAVKVGADKGGKCPDIEVAVKLLRVFTRQECDPDRLRKRLNREVDVWKRLDHANIAKFYGVSFQFCGRPALVMRWYDNGTAPNYLESRTADCRFGLVKDVARGLAYLHTLEPPIVHGDLKGNNVLIDDDGHGLLSDFGLSKVLALAGPTGNTTTTLAGSVRWQGPEMLFDDEDEEEEAEKIPGAFGDCSSRPSSMLSLESDVWSFGCTAYELLTGRLPYEHHLYDWRVIQDIMRGVSPVRPDDTILHQSKGLLVLLNRCWIVEPSKRPMMVEVEVELGGLALCIGG